MSYKIYIDDERELPENYKDFYLVRTVREAITLIKEKGMPEFISFDYYLDYGTTLPLIEYMYYELKFHNLKLSENGFNYAVHSSSSDGKEKIIELFNKWYDVFGLEKQKEKHIVKLAGNNNKSQLSKFQQYKQKNKKKTVY